MDCEQLHVMSAESCSAQRMGHLEQIHCDLRHSDKALGAAKLYIPGIPSRGPECNGVDGIEWRGNDRAGEHNRISAYRKELARSRSFRNDDPVSGKHYV